MTTPQAAAREAAKAQKKRSSDAIMLSLLIALSLSVLSIAASFIFSRVDQAPKAFVPVVSAIWALIGVLLIYRERLLAGATLSLAAFGAALLFLTSQFIGIGVGGALIFTLVAVTLIAHTFPSPINSYSLLLSILAGILLVLLELFWPLDARASLPEGTLPILLAALATGLLVVAFSLRNFRDYSLRQKLISAFLVVSLLPLLIVVYVNNRSLQRQLTLATESGLTAAVAQSAEAVDELIPLEEFLTQIEEQNRTNILVATAVTVIVTLFALWFSGLLIAPLVRLQEAATRVSQGDLDVRAPVESEDEIGWLARTFNTMTEKLQNTLRRLERQLDGRTVELANSAEIGRRLSTILDENRLVSEVADLIQGSFDYSLVQIFLVDEADDSLALVGVTGDPGLMILEQDLRISSGHGPVGRAAAQNDVVLLPDVAADPDWIPNQQLANTKSELAIPITAGDHLLGVMDVQDDVVNGLSQQDSALLVPLANQVAIAIQNARSVARLQRHSERRVMINEINQRIQSTTDARSAMEMMVRELGRAVNAERASVWLYSSADRDNGPSETPDDRDGSAKHEDTERLA